MCLMDEVEIKKAQMRASRRGTREMDAVLGGFSKVGLRELDNVHFNQFLDLLNEDDTKIFRWLILDERHPEKFNEVVDILKSYCRNMQQVAD